MIKPSPIEEVLDSESLSSSMNIGGRSTKSPTHSDELRRLLEMQVVSRAKMSDQLQAYVEAQQIS